MESVLPIRPVEKSRAVAKPLGRDCAECGKPLSYKCERDKERKKFCSKVCANNGPRVGVPFSEQTLTHRICKRCGIDFLGRGRSLYCSKACSICAASAAYDKRKSTIKGFLTKLKNRDNRSALSLEYLLGLYDGQNGVCALSGMEMTFEFGRGRLTTNISLDRIKPKGPYAEGNVRLVCTVVNLMRRDMSDADFVSWCKRVCDCAAC